MKSELAYYEASRMKFLPDSWHLKGPFFQVLVFSVNVVQLVAYNLSMHCFYEVYTIRNGEAVSIRSYVSRQNCPRI
jgi:hypothetical protein